MGKLQSTLYLTDTKRINPVAILIVAAFAAFLATFNETFLNVAFSPIMVDFGIDISIVQWLATGYMLGAAVMVPISAYAYRRFPTRPLFCITVLFLVVGSIIGALAPSFAMLLAGRIVQALGTGMLIPIGMNITLEVAPREKLGSYMGIMGAMTTLGPSSSVILAGLILSVASWRALLWTFAGLSLTCFLLGAILLRNIAKLSHPRLDAVSVALIGLSLVGMLYGISTAFSSAGMMLAVSFASILIGAVFLAIFARRQKRIADPLMDLRPLKVRAFTVGVISNMIALLAIFAMNILIPTYMQSVLGVDSLVASLTLFPAILCSCVLSPIAGRIYDKSGPGVILPLGFACIAIFCVLLSAFISTASVVLLAILYIPVICGSALIIGPVQSYALSKLDYELNPHGVMIMSTGFQIAGCVGSSVFTGIYAFASTASMAGGIPAFDAMTGGMLISGASVGVVAVIGFILSVWIRRSAAIAAQAMVMSASSESALAAPVESSRAILRKLMEADVFTISQESSVADVMRLFNEKRVSGVPVVNAEGGLVGFVSDGDVMRCLADQAPAFKSAWSFLAERENDDLQAVINETAAMKVADIATKKVITVDASDDIGKIARILGEHHLKKAPVLDDGMMIGIVNRSNITRYAIGQIIE